MRLFAAALALSLVSVSLPAPASAVEGYYTVRGSNPGGGGGYSGVVRVRRTGQTYEVVWEIGGTRFVGTGIGGPEGIAVTYRARNNTGVAIYVPDAGGRYTGAWTYAGGREVAEEIWVPR